MVYVQAALAATLCASQPHSAAAAIAASSVPPCHQEAAAERGNTNLCVAHCEAKSQSLDKPSVGIHALPATPVLRIAFIDHDRASRRAVFEPIPPGAPPPLIRFAVLLQ